MVGPNFHSPPPPQIKHFIKDQDAKQTITVGRKQNAEKAQNFNLEQTIPAQWWRMFHSETINKLIDLGFKNNANLTATYAALIQAQENLSAQRGTLFPTIIGNFYSQRQRFSPTQFGGSSGGIRNTGLAGSRTFNLFNANVSAAYTFDLFGGLRRQIEAVGAQVDFQEFELEAAFLTLSSNIVTTAITLASLRDQIGATRQLINAQQKILVLVKGQFQLGGASASDVLAQENLLAQTRSQLPVLEQNLVVQRHALSVLIGEFPNEDGISSFNLDQLNLPKDLPLNCPSLLVKQRPDIKAAEALLHASSAQIGVATANMFPQITLSALEGQQSTFLSALFVPDNNVWSIASNVAQPLFKGGMLMAQRRASIAAYEQAFAQYRQTVLQAFQNVADSLRALEHDALQMKDLKMAETAALKSLNLTRKQFNIGGTTYLNLLNAQRTYQQARIGRIQAQAARYTDTAALFQSLGGGWWNRNLISSSPVLAENLERIKQEIK